MDLETLHDRCKALASVGDEQAGATLAYLFDAPDRAEKEVVELRQKNRELAEANLRLHNENADLKFKATAPVEAETAKLRGNIHYILARIANTLSMAPQLVGMPPKDLSKVVEEMGEAARKLIVPPPTPEVREAMLEVMRKYQENFEQSAARVGEKPSLREDAVKEIVAQTPTLLAMMEKNGIDADPEKLAAAATRAANGMPPETDPGVLTSHIGKAASTKEKGTGV